jgi:flagellar protein FliS
MTIRRNMRAYGNDNVKSQIASADPYTVVQMLMQGALDRLAKAKGCIERKDLEGKAKSISGASAIIISLNESLDLSSGAEVLRNLGGLYNYMIDRVADASRENITEPLDEVIALLGEIKSGWDSIPTVEVQEALALQAAQA